jgi:hypothetical protein
MGHLCKNHESAKKRGRKPQSLKSEEVPPTPPNPTTATFTAFPPHLNTISGILIRIGSSHKLASFPTGSPPTPPLATPPLVTTPSSDGFLVDDSTLISYLLSALTDGHFAIPDMPNTPSTPDVS